MISVIKLKSLVDNKDLPVLTDDGKITNYYVGCYINKLSELGYTLTPIQITAIETFIQDGITNGWINYIKYFLPFIGNKSNPLTGAVPLIDIIDNYQMSNYTFSEDLSKLFIYDLDGYILSMGGKDVTLNNQVIKTPINLSNVYGGISITVNIGPFDKSQLNSNLSYFGVQFYKNSNNLARAIRFNKESTIFQLMYRLTENQESSTIFSIIRPTSIEIDTLYQNNIPFNINLAYYKNQEDNNSYFVRYILSKDNSIENYDRQQTENFIISDISDDKTNNFNANYGNNIYTNLIPIRSWGCFDPFISRELLKSFNLAMFNLNTMLGR